MKQVGGSSLRADSAGVRIQLSRHSPIQISKAVSGSQYSWNAVANASLGELGCEIFREGDAETAVVGCSLVPAAIGQPRIGNKDVANPQSPSFAAHLYVKTAGFYQ